MKLITRDTDYAVRAVCFIADSKDKVVSADNLVRQLKMPRPFLRKILQKLEKGGILGSLKGKSGGFRLFIPAGKIFLTDIMEIFQGPFRLNECVFKKRPCPARIVCRLRKKICTIEKSVLTRLQCISLASLI